jgi:hypothetical protein
MESSFVKSIEDNSSILIVSSELSVLLMPYISLLKEEMELT